MVGNSETPFIITQTPDHFSEISHIVMPFSYAKETLQVAQFAATLAKKFKASIDLVGYRDSDEWLLKDMAASICECSSVALSKSIISHVVGHRALGP